MSTSALKVVTDNTELLRKALAALTESAVLVGVPEEDGQREPDKEGGKTPQVTNAIIGYVMEFGSPKMNVPARPTLFPGVRDAQSAVTRYLGQAARYALKGESDGVERGLAAAGSTASQSVKSKINSNVPPELSERTLQARQRRGVTRTNTLVDTGQFRNSITYVLILKGSREASNG